MKYGTKWKPCINLGGMDTKDKASLSKSHLIRTDIYYWYSEGMFACAYGTQTIIIIPLISPSSRRRFVILSYQYRKTVSRLFTGTNLIYCPYVNHTVRSQTLNHCNRENEITTWLWNLNWSCNIVFFFFLIYLKFQILESFFYSFVFLSSINFLI